MSSFYFRTENLLRNFNLNNKLEVKDYKSFIELETVSIKLPSSTINGLSIEINSDFLRKP